MRVPLSVLLAEETRAEGRSRRALAHVEEAGARCAACQLGGCGQGPVAPSVSSLKPPTLVVVAEAPGDREVDRGEPLVGRSGQLLMRWLWRANGIQRHQVHLTNVAACKPPDMHLGDWKARLAVLKKRSKRAGEDPPDAETEPPEVACAPRLEVELRALAAERTKPGVILALGKIALEALARLLDFTPESMSEAAGAVFQSGPESAAGAWRVVPAYHPAFVLRSPVWTGPTRDAVLRAGLLAQGIEAPPRFESVKAGYELCAATFEWVEPAFMLGVRPVQEYINWMEEVRARGWEVACDIEAAGPGKLRGHKGEGATDPKRNILRCVALAHTESQTLGHPDGQRDRVIDVPDGRVAVLPVRGMDGTPHYAPEDERALQRAFRTLHDDERAGLVGQNYNFDFQSLLEKGWATKRSKVADDLLILHRATVDCDLPHSLSFIARRVYTLPVWKGFPHASRDPALNPVLWDYNARDALVTARCVPWLREWVRVSGNGQAYGVDRELNTQIRQMGKDIGVWIDEHRRGAFSREVNDACHEARVSFGDLTEAATGRRLNPASPDQLIDLLYGTGPGEWGLEPLIGTDNKDYDEETSEPGTSATAIAALIRQGLDEEKMRVLRVLAAYRDWDKLRGTYIDGLPTRHPGEAALLTLPEAERVAPLVRGEPHDKDLPDRPESEGGPFFRHGLPERPGLSRMFPTYKASGPPTGRLSCDDPNLQSTPSRGRLNIKKMYRAAPGHVLVGADWSQLELRLACLASEDEVLRRDIIAGKDPHSANAAALAILSAPGTTLDQWYGWIELGADGWLQFANDGERALARTNPKAAHKKFRDRWRNLAKREYFLITYGGRGEKLYNVMSTDRDNEGNFTFGHLSMEDVLRTEAGWHEVHPATRRWHEEVKDQVLDAGFIEIPHLDHRRRWFLWNAQKEMNAAVNFGIQACAGSLANRSTLELCERIPFRSWSPETGMAWQVHDCLVWQVPEDRAEEAARIMAEVMNKELGGLPLPAEVDISLYYDGI